jgi:Tfp pilus assembly ATPase PilU
VQRQRLSVAEIIPLVLPPNFRDVTAEKVGTVIGIVGATAAAKATKPG